MNGASITRETSIFKQPNSVVGFTTSNIFENSAPNVHTFSQLLRAALIEV